jgi:hypothetical protein
MPLDTLPTGHRSELEPTLGASPIRIRRSVERTSSSGRSEIEELIEVPRPRAETLGGRHAHLSAQRIFDAARDVHLQLFSLTNRLARDYERASTSGREADWERFVHAAEGIAPAPRPDELWWIYETSCRAKGYRAAVALARATAVIAECHQELDSFWALVLSVLARHPSPEVRRTVIEAAADARPALARLVLLVLPEEKHPAVREAIKAVQAMR